MKESELIASARENSDHEINTVLEACEEFYMSGCTDEMSGDVETFGHFYRVDRWMVYTDNQGFHDLETFNTEEDAITHFEKLDRDYAATFDTDDCF